MLAYSVEGVLQTNERRSNLPALLPSKSAFLIVTKNSYQLLGEGRLLRGDSNDELY
jgi:hypothetical protein